MDDPEEKFTLRDKLAIEILKLSYNPDKESIFTEYTKNVTIDKKDKNNNVIHTAAYLDELDGILAYQEEAIIRKLRGAYKIADLMRKVRLGAFE